MKEYGALVLGTLPGPSWAKLGPQGPSGDSICKSKGLAAPLALQCLHASPYSSGQWTGGRGQKTSLAKHRHLLIQIKEDPIPRAAHTRLVPLFSGLFGLLSFSPSSILILILVLIPHILLSHIYVVDELRATAPSYQTLRRHRQDVCLFPRVPSCTILAGAHLLSTHAHPETRPTWTVAIERHSGDCWTLI